MEKTKEERIITVNLTESEFKTITENCADIINMLLELEFPTLEQSSVITYMDASDNLRNMLVILAKGIMRKPEDDPESIKKEIKIKELEKELNDLKRREEKREVDEKINNLLHEKERINKRIKVCRKISNICEEIEEILNPIKLFSKAYDHIKK